MTADRVDLFGAPVDPGHGLRGRPRHMPSAETRAAVAGFKAQGLSHLQIAAAIGVTGPTLRLNYREELQSLSMASQLRVERDERRNEI